MTQKALPESSSASPAISLFPSHVPLSATTSSAAPPPFQALSYVWGIPIHLEYVPMTVTARLHSIVQEVILAWKAMMACGSGEGVVVDWEDARDALQLFEWMILCASIDPKYRRLYELLGNIMPEEYGLDVLCYHGEIASWTDRGLPAVPRNSTVGSVDLDGPGCVLGFDAAEGIHWPLNSTVKTAVIGDLKLALFLPKAVMSIVVRMGLTFTSVPGQEKYRRNSGRSSLDIRIRSMFNRAWLNPLIAHRVC